MKRALLILTIALYSLSGVCAPHGKFGKNLSWRYDPKTQTLYVNGTGDLPYCIWGKKDRKKPVDGMPYSFVYPDRIRGKWGVDVKNVCLSEGITSIGRDVFRFCHIEDFTMPASMEYAHAFYGCGIERLHYNGTMEQWLNGRIAERCLRNTNRVDRVFVDGQELGGHIVIPSTVSHIPAYALSYKEISSLVLPASVKSVDKNAFDGSKIDTVFFLGTMEEWCAGEYGPVSKYRRGPLLIQGKPVPAALSLNDTITRIGSYAFYNMTSLESVVLPANLRTIGDSAFCGTSLQKIDLPQSLQNIGKGAFGRTKIYTVTWRMPRYKGNIKIFNDSPIMFFTFKESVRDIPDSICYVMERLRYLTIENGVRGIGQRAFAFTGLYKVILPPSVDFIGHEAFYDCYLVREVTIPNSSCAISPSAFRRCSRLTREPRAGITVDDSRQKEKMPVMKAYDRNGRLVDITPKLQDGHMSILLFVDRTCKPARRMLQHVEDNLELWRKQYPDLQVVLLYNPGTSPDRFSSIGECFIRQKGYGQSILGSVFDVNSVPFMVFYDKYGKKIGAILGYNPQHIERLLQKTYESK